MYRWIQEDNKNSYQLLKKEGTLLSFSVGTEIKILLGIAS